MNYKQIHKLYWDTVDSFYQKTEINFNEWYKRIITLFKEDKIKYIVAELNVNHGHCNGITLIFAKRDNIVPILEMNITNLKDYIK